MEFIEYRVKRSDHRSKAEEFARKLIQKFKEQQKHMNAAASFAHEGNDNSNVNDTVDVLGFNANCYSNMSRVGGKKDHSTYF